MLAITTAIQHSTRGRVPHNKKKEKRNKNWGLGDMRSEKDDDLGHRFLNCKSCKAL